jgi:hypothetical protein
MIGDTNLFLPDGPKEDVECEIMIAGKLLIPTSSFNLGNLTRNRIAIYASAESNYRGKGLSIEILSLL